MCMYAKRFNNIRFTPIARYYYVRSHKGNVSRAESFMIVHLL